MEKEGTRREELAGKDDKRQLTAVFGGSMAGHFLPIQLIYQEKAQRCVPKVNFQLIGMLLFLKSLVPIKEP